MDGSRFDRWTQTITGVVSRRSALRTFAGALALAGAAARSERAGACKADGRTCTFATDCCSNRCDAGLCGRGGLGEFCRSDAGCTSRVCGKLVHKTYICRRERCRRSGRRCSLTTDCCQGFCSTTTFECAG